MKGPDGTAGEGRDVFAKIHYGTERDTTPWPRVKGPDVFAKIHKALTNRCMYVSDAHSDSAH